MYVGMCEEGRGSVIIVPHSFEHWGVFECIRVCMGVCVYTCVHVRVLVCACVCMCVHVHMCVCMRAYVGACVCALGHTDGNHDHDQALACDARMSRATH